MVSPLSRVIWAPHGDRAAALRAISIGMLASLAGVVVVFGFTVRTLLLRGFSVSGIVFPIFGGALLGMAAIWMHRRAPLGLGLALSVWIILGVVAPIEIPDWLALIVLLPMVTAVRGAHVLRRLPQITEERPGST